jgi:predicted regulator of Ras-like GTPase activity (Roadblock/LC7/MglB family)
MSAGFASLLDGLTRVVGVRSALVVDREDGLVVAETSMEGVDAGAVAALAASLAARLARALRAAGHAEPALLHLEAETGALMAAPASAELLVVAVCDPGANVGLLRLALKDARERLG